MSSSTASTAIWHSPSAIFAAAERVPPHPTAATQAGIHEVEFDSQYQSMFSYKAKNAAFLLEDGRVIVKGGALRSRGREPVLRRYLQDTLRMLLERRQDDAGKLFDSYTQAISSRTLPIEDLCKSQTLHTTLEDYRLAVKAGSRNREVAFELALRSAALLGRRPRELLHYRWQGSLL